MIGQAVITLLALAVGVLGAVAAAWLLLALGVLYLRHRVHQLVARR